MSLTHAVVDTEISAAHTGTPDQAMDQIAADAVAAGWTVTDSGTLAADGRSLLLDAPVTACQVALVYDGTPAASYGAPETGTIPSDNLCIGLAPAGGLASGNLLLAGSQAALWAGYWSFGPAGSQWGRLLTAFSDETVWLFNHNPSDGFSWAVAGFAARADAPEAGQTSLDAEGRVPLIGACFNMESINNFWVSTSTGRFLTDDQGGAERPNVRFYSYGNAAWRNCRLRDVYRAFNPFDLRGNFVEEDIAIEDIGTGAVVGRLSGVKPALATFGAPIVPSDTGVPIGKCWAPSESSLVGGILFRS